MNRFSTKLLSFILAMSLFVSQGVVSYAAEDFLLNQSDDLNNENASPDDDSENDNNDDNGGADEENVNNNNEAGDDGLFIVGDDDEGVAGNDELAGDWELDGEDSDLDDLTGSKLLGTDDTNEFGKENQLLGTVNEKSGVIKNVTWELDDNGVLTFDGEGSIPDYQSHYENNVIDSIDTPWFEYRDEIRELVIGDGITSIGTWAFAALPNLTVVDLGDGLTTIGDDAFSESNVGLNIELSETLEYIGEGAFFKTKLTSITIPENVRFIGFAAFMATNIEVVDIKTTDFETSKFGDVFENCPIGKLTLPSGLKTIPKSFFGTVQWKANTQIVIPNTVETIESMAFEDMTVNKNAVELVFEEDSHLTTIGSDAFQWLNLTNSTLTIPSSVRVIETYAFEGMGPYVKKVVIGDGVTSLGDGAFTGKGLTEVLIPETVTSMVGTPFYNPDSEIKLYVVKGSYAHEWAKEFNKTNQKYVIMTTPDITYYLNGGTNNPGNPGSYETGDELVLLDPSRAGYVFDGWFYDAQFKNPVGEKVDTSNGADLNIYAKWSIKTYDVSYDVNAEDAVLAGDASVAVAYNAVYPKVLATATRPGYTFAGWYTEAVYGTKIVGGTTKFTSNDPDNAKVYAHWTPITYKVRFNSNYPTGKNTSVVKNFTYDKVTKLNSVKALKFASTGYSFDGWALERNPENKSQIYEDGEEVFNLRNTSNSVIDLYAQWKPVDYIVFFNAGNADGVEDGTLELGKNNLMDLTDNGLEAYNWNVAKTADQAFDLDNYTSAKGYVQAFKLGESVDLSGDEFVRAGYTLIGWKNENTRKTIKNGTLSNVTTKGEVVVLTAQWSPTKYTVKYNNNGGTIKKGIAVPTSYTVNNNGFDLPNEATITKTGYTFKGWFDNKDFAGEAITRVEFETFKGQVLNLYANWEKNSYTLNFDKNAADAVMAEGQDASVALDYDESYTLSKDLFTRNGYTFASWNTQPGGNGKKYTATANVKNLKTGATDNESITLFAQWTPNTYKITYDLQGGKQSGAPTSYKTNTGAILKTPVKTGYKFMGWISDNEDVVISENNTISKNAGNYGNVKLAAQWEAIKYSVVVMHDSVEENYTDDVISYGENVDMSDVAKLFDDEAAENQSIDYFTTQPNGKGAKYYVNRYYKNLASVEGAKVVLYPHWGSKTYRIVYEADFGTDSDGFGLSDITNLTSMPVTYDPTKATKLVMPTVKGFSFEGYEVDSLVDGAGTEWLIVPDKKTKNISLAKDGKGDLKITLKFKPVAYTVVLMPNAKDVYEVVDESRNKASNHTYSNVPYAGEYVTEDLKDESLRRFGYEFVGFNTSANGKGTDLAKDENGKFVLSGLSQKNTTVKCYAIWKGVNYNISYYESVDHAYSVNDNLADYTSIAANTKTNKNPATGVGGKAVKFNNPVKAGYTFTGWTVIPAAPSVYGVHYTTKGPNGPITGLSSENEIDAVAIANFTPIIYKLNISSNGGVISSTKKSGTVSLGSFKYDADVKDDLASEMNGKFTRKGYAFAGFALDSRSKKMIMDETGALLGDFAGETEVAGLATKNNQTVTVYAVWEKVVADKPVITSATLQDGSLSLNYTVGKTAADTEYVIEYSNSLLFRNKVSNTVAETSANIEGLTSGKTYYIRVKQTKTDSQGNTVSGAWSKTVKVK